MFHFRICGIRMHNKSEGYLSLWGLNISDYRDAFLVHSYKDDSE